MMNNGNSKHQSNGFRCLSSLELLAKLKQIKSRLTALVYCQRDRTPNIGKEIKIERVTVLDVKNDFVSSRKQEHHDFTKQFHSLHESLELELKHRHLLLWKDCDSHEFCRQSSSKGTPKTLRSVPTSAPPRNVRAPILLSWTNLVANLTSQQLNNSTFSAQPCCYCVLFKCSVDVSARPLLS